ncbi:MAG: hypothetical protein AAF597_06910, partial [Bacteroidota bacterium]
YSVRYYFPPTERTALETDANAHITNNPSCYYAYKFPVPNGFYWFKNTGSAYVPPQYDGPVRPTSSSGDVSGINYVELSGITSFSGGSGAITLVPQEVVAFLDNEANGFPSIQEAVDAAVDGQILYVLPGDYLESLDVGTKQLTIRLGSPPSN